jgi:hypothetical protein
MDPSPLSREEESDRHWATVSNLTQLAERGRVARRATTRHGARRRLGLVLVRAGLAVAPLRVEDIDEHRARLG